MCYILRDRVRKREERCVFVYTYIFVILYKTSVSTVLFHMNEKANNNQQLVTESTE